MAALAVFLSQILAALEEAVTEVEPLPPSPALVQPLSEREVQVLELMGAGRSNREIGLTLSISLATVEWHASNIYGNLGVGNRTEAVVRARRPGLLTAASTRKRNRKGQAFTRE